MKIVKLQAENVKRLKAIEITPDGNLVIIGDGAVVGVEESSTEAAKLNFEDV